MMSRQCSFSLNSVSHREVLKLISGLKNSKSTGVDLIDTWVFKLSPTLSISWKLSTVGSLLKKKGEPLAQNNYNYKVDV